MRKNFVRLFLHGAVSLIICGQFAGCASIVSGGPKKVTVNSRPPGARVMVYDKSGKVIMTSQTPATLSLDRSSGYFRGEDYRIVIEKPGYKRAEITVRAAINGWYFGNLAFGGVIGMLVVDPLTGAMYTLDPDKIDQILTPVGSGRSSEGRKPGLGLILKDQLTPEQASRLKLLTVNG
jgi:PEGA domain